jgi:drug/metabolite transporter (DMT)-like permease
MRLWAATYLLICIPLWIYLLIKEKKVYQPFSKKEGLKLASGLAEVSAYTLYILALEQEPFFVSFLSSTYCVFSILFCRIFLKEKLSKGQYLCIAVIIAGLALFGIAEGLAA